MKYYVREGRRFVQVKSLKGMFYNNDETFTKKRTNKSIGICVYDDFNETIIASLIMHREKISYTEAEFLFETSLPYKYHNNFFKWHMPTSYELLMLENISNAKFEYHNCYLWVSDPSLINSKAYCLYFANGLHTMYYSNKDYKRFNVIPFLTIKK